jgi:hypothetical protein
MWGPEAKAMETPIRVVWQLSEALAERHWSSPHLLVDFFDIFDGLSYLEEPRPVFKCEDEAFAKRTREWSGRESEAALPSSLRRFFEAWLVGPSDAMELISRIQNWSKAEGRVLANGPVRTEARRDVAGREKAGENLVGGYLAPRLQGGVGAAAAWRKPGGSGAWDASGVRTRVHVVDIELGANINHLELKGRVTELATGGMRDEHGTAVLGILAPNGAGKIHGLIPEAGIAIAPASAKRGSTMAEELTLWCVAANCPPGSVMLLERVVPKFLRYRGGAAEYSHELPLEAFDSARAAIAAVVDQLKISVVECCGNSGKPVDSYLDGDCGAILVGSSDQVKGEWGPTNYGKRVHLHSWGQDVVTCGEYAGCHWESGLGNSGDPDHCYTTFSGTSSAGAIVAGVVGSATGLLSAAGKQVEPRDLRKMLFDSGYYMTTAIEKSQIGRHPDLEKFILDYVL